MDLLVIPGYDSKNGNTNSCLFKAYGVDKCEQYVLNKPLEEQNFMNFASEKAVVHSYGFFIFIVMRKLGFFSSVKQLVVLDGWFPYDCKFNGKEYPIDLPEDILMTFFFPTVGNRKDYPLEAVVRQQMVKRKDIHVVRGINFGHNLIYNEFTPDCVTELVESLLPEKMLKYDNVCDFILYFPQASLHF